MRSVTPWLAPSVTLHVISGTGRHSPLHQIEPDQNPRGLLALSTPGRRRPARPRTRWPSSDVLRVALLVAGVYLLLKLFWIAHSIFLLAFLGVLFGIVLAVPVDWLHARRVPRALAVVLVVLGLAGVGTGLGVLITPQIARQWEQLQQQLPQALNQARDWVQQRQGRVQELLGDSSAAESAAPAPAPAQAPTQESGGLTVLGGVTSRFFAVFSSTLAVVAGILLLIFVTIYIAADPGLYHDGLLHLVPKRHRGRASEVLHETGLQLRRWMVTQAIAMLVIGSVTTVALLVIGVKAAFALGIIAGLLEFIPIVGPILSAIPAIGMAFIDSPDKALVVALAYTAIQQMENHLLIPLLMKGRVDLPPVLTLLSQAVMSVVFGFVGLLVAVPLLATVMIPARMLYVRDVVGEPVSLPGDQE